MVHRFGEFELDLERGELRRRGRAVRIRPRPFAVLRFLVEQRDRFVSADELLEAVWSGVAVSESALSSALKDARRALGDDGASQRFIETSRRRGYRFVMPVEPVGLATHVREAPNRPRAGLFGRDELLGVARSALTDAAEGRGRMLALSGRAGVGKSAIVQELLAEARRRGMGTGSAVCLEGEVAPAYWPWIQLLRERIGPREPEELERELGAQVRVWLPLLHGGAAPGPTGLAPGESRFELFDAISLTLIRLAEGRGLVIAIDDLHWADVPSLHLLEFVARTCSGRSILLLTTHRSDELPADHPHAALVARATGRGAADSLAIEGLSPEAVRSWLTEEMGFDLSDALLSALHSRTGGNPFFIRQLMGLLTTSEGQRWLADPKALLPSLPAGIGEVIRDRLQRLEDAAHAVLREASVCGEQIQPSFLATAFERDRSELLGHLDAAASLGLVREVGPFDWRFDHALIREALYSDLPRSERSDLHRRVARALQTASRGGGSPSWSELAHHAARAATGDDLEKAIEYSERAGREAMQQFAFEEAESQLERALRLQASLPVVPEPHRCELLIALGNALAGSGRIEAARERLVEAGDIARRAGEPVLLARAALAFAGPVSVSGRVDTEVARVLEQARVALAGRECVEAVLVTSRLAFELLNGPDAETSHELTEQAITGARRLGDGRALGWALLARAWELFSLSDPEEPLAISSETLRLAESTGDVAMATMARNSRIRALLQLGQIEAVRVEVDELERWVRSRRVTVREHSVAFRRSMLALLEGRVSDAREELMRGSELASRFDDLGSRAVSAALLVTLAREDGSLAELEPVLRAALERSPWHLPWRCVLAELYARDGKHEEARRWLEPIVSGARTRIPCDGNWHVTMALAAEVCRHLRDVRAASVLLPLVEPHVRIHVVIGSAVACLGSMARPAGLLAATLGRRDEAIRYLELAIERNDRLEARPYAAAARLDLAELLLEEPDPDAAVREQARALVQAVERSIEGRGLEHLESRLRSMGAFA